MTSERKKRRWWVWALGGTLGVVVSAGVAGYILLDRYAADIVTDALADADLPNPRLDVDAIGLSESSLSDIKLGDDDALVADRIVLDYDIFDLIDLDLSDLTIRLERPVLKVNVDANGAISLGSLDALASGGGGESDQEAALPFREVVLDDATVLLDTPEGLIEASVDGIVRNEGEDGLIINATLAADNDLALFDGDLALTVGPTGAIGGDATIRGLDGDTPWGRVEGGAGTIHLRWDRQGIPVGDIDLVFQAIDVPAGLLPPALADADSDMTVRDVALDVSFDGSALDAAVDMSDAGGQNAMSLNINVPDILAGGESSVAADLSTNGEHLFWLWHPDWVADGALTASIETTMNLPPLADLLAAPETLFTLPSGQISLQWILNDANLPGLASDVSSVGAIEVVITDSIATLTSRDPVELRIGAIAAETMTALGTEWVPILQRDMAGQIDIALDGRGSHPLTLTMALREEGWSVRGDGTILAATTGGPLAAVEVSGNATIGEALAVALEDLSIYASDVDTPAASFGVLELAGRFAYRDDMPDFDIAGAAVDLNIKDPQLSFPRLAVQLAMSETDAAAAPGVLGGPLRMNFADSGGTIDDVVMTGLSGEVTGRLLWEDGLAQMFFTENAVFRVEAMDIDGDVLIPDPAIVRVTASEHPVLELDLNSEDGWSLRHSLNVGPLDVRGSIRMGDERVQTALQTRELEMTGGYLEGRYIMRIDVALASARAPARGWTLGSGSVGIDYDDNDEQNLIVISANVTGVASDATTGALPTMGIRGRMDYGNDDIIRISARAFDSKNLLVVDVNANHDVNTNVGSAGLDVQNLIFTPGVMQPSDISPLLTGFENVTGTADVEGRIAWSGSTITPQLKLLVGDITGSYDDVEFSLMNAEVELASLSPLATQPGQLLTIAAVDPGMPITNAEVVFALTDGDILSIDNATFDLAGGAVTVDNQAISFSEEEQKFDLAVTGVDLGTLLDFADLEDLEAQGTLDGTIPIVVVDGDVVIPDAQLEAREPGFIRYDAGDDLGAVGDSNAGVGLMVDLLKNFQYDTLVLSLTRPVAGDMQAGFRILGRNPDVYGGVPIDLTLNVDGQLEDVIRNSLEIYHVPQTIQDMILQHGLDAATPPG